MKKKTEAYRRYKREKDENYYIPTESLTAVDETQWKMAHDKIQHVVNLYNMAPESQFRNFASVLKNPVWTH